jgi:UDP-arabinose 4-epimerase
MRVLVTGGAGYIGSHTCKGLSRAGHEPIVLDNLRVGHRWAVKWGPLLHGDLADAAFIRQVLAAHEIEAVIHFAASAYVGESMREPRNYFRNNVANTLNLLDAVIDAGIRRIVFSSTCATFGIPSRVPIADDEVQSPINPYGESKRFVERVLDWYGKAYGLSWVALRYFNAAGADPEGELGEEHDPETHLIPLAIQAALGERGQLELYGTDYPTPDGTNVRDYIHVSDLASAHLLALEYLAGERTVSGARPQSNENSSAAAAKGASVVRPVSADPQGIAVNLGGGWGYSVREVISSVELVSGCRVPVRTTARRPGDPPILVADSTLARRLLNWQPRFSNLDTIVETAWHWHRSRTQQLVVPKLAAHAASASTAEGLNS